MDIILEAGLPHQQIPVDRLAYVLKNTHMDEPHRPYENPLIDMKSAQTGLTIREIVYQKDLRPYNRKVIEPVENGNVLNLDIKMETGTGKTYVYTHSIYELHKQYGFNKFVIVVHSLAVKSGVVQFISDPYVQRHFRDTLGYDADIDLCEVVALKKKKKGHNHFPSSVRDFISGSCQNKNRIYVLVVNQQLLQKNKLLDKQDYDITVQNFRRPLSAIKATRPILIIDEPHRFERSNTTYKRLLSEIAPQLIIRFGATFPEISEGRGKQKETRKDYLNLLYNLTACDAFNQNLIKGVAKEHFNPTTSENEKVKIVRINGKESVTMHFTRGVQKKGKQTQEVQTRTFEMHERDSLGIISSNLAGLTIDGISQTEVVLSNGQIKHQGDEFTADIYAASYQEYMMRLAIQRHFETERKLFARDSKIKALSLFFIDNIVSFRGDDNGNGAWLRDMFDRLLTERLNEELQNEENSEEYISYLKASLDAIDACRAGYFAKDNSDSDEAIAEEVDDILRNKKKLMSFKNEEGEWNVRRFLFSKWTLKEGWDNPNVFTICKLRSSGSETSKLQEVGRGLRLPVDQYGNRTVSDDFMLNYIVDFTEKDFADQLVREINGDVMKAAQEHIVINSNDLERVAKQRGMESNALLVELLMGQWVTMQGSDIIVIDDKVMEFKNAYPEFEADSLNINRVVDRNAKGNRDKVKIRKENYQKLDHLWKDLNRKYLMFYQKNIDDEIRKALPEILENGVFTRMSVSSERSEIEVNSEGASVVQEANVTYLTHGKNIPYHQFLKRASRGTSINIEMIHQAIVEYAKSHEDFNNNLINDLTLSHFIRRFLDWKIKKLGGCITYKQANYRVKTTALTKEDGTPREEVVMGRIGTKTDNSPTPPEYLYEPIAYDSPLEKTNILDSIDVAKLIVYGKIPKNSIRIPTITDETYSPDFMYVVEKKDCSLQMNVVIETKDVYQDANLRFIEDAKIDCAKEFFKSLQKDHPECKIEYERQINQQRMNDIIYRLVNNNGG